MVRQLDLLPTCSTGAMTVLGLFGLNLHRLQDSLNPLARIVTTKLNSNFTYIKACSYCTFMQSYHHESEFYFITLSYSSAVCTV